jgi:hypothetical protein
VIEPSFGRVRQVNGEELEYERVIVCPACPAREAVVLQTNAGIGFTIILDDVIGCSKMLMEACATHVAPERLGPWPLGAKFAPFSIAASAVMRVACAILEVFPFVPPVSLMARRRLRTSTQVAWLEMGRGLHR